MKLTPVVSKHKNTFIAEVKFMHGDADAYTTEEITIDDEEGVHQFMEDMKWIHAQDKSYHRLGGHNRDGTVAEVQASEQYRRWWVSGSEEDYHDNVKRYADNGWGDYGTLEEYWEGGEHYWPGDQTTYGDIPASCDGYTIYWYDENGAKYKVEV